MQKLFTLLLVLCCCFCADAKRIYVNINATGSNNGTSWANAFTELSIPLDDNNNIGDTFWVANGVYTSHTFEPYSFHMMGGTVLYGGFDGSETMLSQRNWSTFNTVLAGNNTYPNSVVYSDGTGRLDGFKVTHSAGPSQTTTFGMNLGGTNITIENCLITNIWGTVTTVSAAVSLNLINCQFINNGPSATTGAPIQGSALRCQKNAVINVTDCVFKKNTGTHGGAAFLDEFARVTFNRCTFSGNIGQSAGGVFYDNKGAVLRVFNSAIVGNIAGNGGVHYSLDSLNSARNFTHCTIADNRSIASGFSNYTLWLRGTKDTLRNCILWGDSTGGPEVPNPKTGSMFSKNLIEGGNTIFGASGTYTFNPKFVSPGGAATAPFAVTTNHNYHLNPFSEAIDTGANLALAAPFNLDADKNARAQGRFPDLGTYEWKSCPWNTLSIAASGPTSFCQPGSVLLTASGNLAYSHVYQWNGGASTGPAITVSTSGVNTVVVVDSLGCRAAASMTVNAVAIPNPTITQSGNTLSVPAIYATYQWYRGGNPISGATSASYTATANGSYTVKVTTIIAGCTGTSAAYSLTNVSVGSSALENAVSIYPNPGNGQFTVSIDGQAARNVTITVRTITGENVFQEHYESGGSQFSKMVDVRCAARGVYFVELLANDERLVKKIVIQ